MSQTDETYPQSGRPANFGWRYRVPILSALFAIVAAGLIWLPNVLSSFEPGLSVALSMMLLAAALWITWSVVVAPSLQRLREDRFHAAMENRQLLFQLRHDDLTGLPNRSNATEHIAGVLSEPHEDGFQLVFLHLDIDGFKKVNTTLGHLAGDQALKIIAERIQSNVRSSDLVARLGADEFGVCIAPIFSIESVQDIADRLQAALKRPITVEDHTWKLGCSIGVSVSSDEGETAESILLQAEIALAQARAQGNGQIEYFTHEIRKEIEQRQAVARELAVALQRDEIQPYYQPQIDLETGRVVGFEALARWVHPERNVLTPFHFLSVAEENGLVSQIGDAVLSHALRALRCWDEAGFVIPKVGVNFSEVELKNPQLVDTLKWTLESNDVSPDRVAVEILETVLIGDDNDIVARNIHELAKAGFSIELDDFGTGRASIANIRRFPVSRIKLDRAFVTRLDQDPEQFKLLSSMVDLAKNVQIEVLAEGVETPGEQRALADAGCMFAQGYNIARPMPLDATLEWLKDQGGHVAPERRQAGLTFQSAS
jgi:diguanylate cyclase (GGDEF)-like protein